MTFYYLQCILFQLTLFKNTNKHKNIVLYPIFILFSLHTYKQTYLDKLTFNMEYG